jgi:hypothetical protein
MHKFKAGKLHSGSKHGKTVKSRAQAIAIMMSERENENAHGGDYVSSGERANPLEGTRKRHGSKK